MKRIFTKSRMILLWKIVVFLVAAFTYLLIFKDLSSIAGFFWGPGIIFSFVVMTWHATSFRAIANWRSVAFFIAFTGIYLVVCEICFIAIFKSTIDIFNNEVLNPLSIPQISIKGGPLVDLVMRINIIIGPLFGSIMSPIVHALLLGASLKRTLIAIACMCGSLFAFYPIASLESVELLNPIGLMIILWQAVYLVSMFSFRKKEVEAVVEKAQT